MTSRRILITGLSTRWGGRLAAALERDTDVEAVIGIDRGPPKLPLERTEFVRVADSHSLIRRIVHAAEIDTVVDTRLVTDATVTDGRRAHENNVVGTMNVLAACGGRASPVRKVVVRSSAHWYGCNQDDPAYFTEGMERGQPPRTAIERDIVEAEAQVADFAERHRHVTVCVLRFADGIGPSLRTAPARMLGLPAIPMILGFDPRWQLVHEDDIARCLEHAVRHDVPGTYNCAADGVLALSEVAGLLGKPVAPVLPPWGTGAMAALLRRAGLPLTPELLRQLRFGRALDNRRLKATGFRYRHTTREAVLRLREHQRIAPVLAREESDGDGYRYEEEVEEFLRRSPSVRASERLRRARLPRNTAPGAEQPAQRPALDDLEVPELVALLPSLEPAALEALRAHEAAGRARPEVLGAIKRLQRWEAPA